MTFHDAFDEENAVQRSVRTVFANDVTKSAPSPKLPPGFEDAAGDQRRDAAG
jgi:hypothetical protein